MVTLLGFFFILTNVACLELFMPDLVGPVSKLISVIVVELTDKRCLQGPSWLYYSFAFGLWM
jgi:ethanolaminephosphotransferase